MSSTTHLNDYDLAESINRRVNFSTEYRTDLKQYGVPDFWSVAKKYGDCEDYALAKRKALLDLGWPADKLGLVVCVDETCTGHCVLWVMTDKGSYILDNRYEWPMLPSSLPYKWESMLCNGVWCRLFGWSS